MLTSLSLQGYKAVFRASLQLGPFTLLIGRNGSGKSSAVEAIQWLRDATFLGLDAATPPGVEFDELVNRRCSAITVDLQFRGGQDSRPVHYTLRAITSTQRPLRPIVDHERCVVGKTMAASLVIHSRKGKRGPAYRWVSGRGGSLAVRDGDELALRLTRTRGTRGARELVDFLSRAVFVRLSPTAIATAARAESRRWRPLLSEDGRDLASLLLSLRAQDRRRVVARLEAIFPSVTALSAARIDGEDRFGVTERMRSRGGTKPFYIPSPLLSEGMRRLVAIFALLEVDPPPSLLVIEEIENGLDPWTLEHVLDALREISNRTQIILTTHSPFLLDHVTTQEVVHVRRETGDTSYQRVSELSEAARYDRVLAPGAMYLSNVFADKASTGDGEEG